jgi:hypothetical protein
MIIATIPDRKSRITWTQQSHAGGLVSSMDTSMHRLRFDHVYSNPLICFFYSFSSVSSIYSHRFRLFILICFFYLFSSVYANPLIADPVYFSPTFTRPDIIRATWSYS